jgi:hypothetical protein
VTPAAAPEATVTGYLAAHPGSLLSEIRDGLGGRYDTASLITTLAVLTGWGAVTRTRLAPADGRWVYRLKGGEQA